MEWRTGPHVVKHMRPRPFEQTRAGGRWGGYGVLEPSSDRCCKSGRRASANACQPKYWLNGDNKRGGNAVCSEDHNGSRASTGAFCFFSTTARAVGSENASRHCNAVVNHDDDCLNGEKCRHSGQDDPDPSEAVSEDGANHRMESDGNDTIPRLPLRFPLGPFASTPATTPGRLSCLWISF